MSIVIVAGLIIVAGAAIWLYLRQSARNSVALVEKEQEVANANRKADAEQKEADAQAAKRREDFNSEKSAVSGASDAARLLGKVASGVRRD